MVIKNKKKFIFMTAVTLLLLASLVLLCIFLYNEYTGQEFIKTYYTAEDFGIETIYSTLDYNNNGADDYTDILLGAREDAKNKPTYISEYYQGGYPPDDKGVCTDVIWRALKNAGYLLKDMVDKDIKANLSSYPRVGGKPDSNIDFRRVPNLKVFFERNFEELTLDLNDIAAWQPGDIVIFGDEHIGIISDKRNSDGVPYLIHNSGQPFREENSLWSVHNWKGISGHYRFDMENRSNLL